MLQSKLPFGIRIREVGQMARKQRAYRIPSKSGFSLSGWTNCVFELWIL